MERPSVHTSTYPTDHSRRSDGASQRFTLCIRRRNAAQTAQRDLVRCRKTREFLQLSSPPRLFCPLRRIIPERAMERPSVSHFSPSDGHSGGSYRTPCVSHLKSSNVPQGAQWTEESPAYSSVYSGFSLSRRIISEGTTDTTPR